MEIVKLSDFYLVSYLVSRGLKIVGTNRVGDRTFFLFYLTPLLKEEVNNFRYGNDDMVSAQIFCRSIQQLKDILYGGHA
ncbi:MAG: DUF5659 domain-containing protein [Kiritimatiellae bacterium]|nr:DUF5659 domain-containing protein [Kiritimatiellia bacterium]MDD5519459.1 DUF5659 domain-containing protein [Kiritimatiellia bacterium]